MAHFRSLLVAALACTALAATAHAQDDDTDSPSTDAAPEAAAGEATDGEAADGEATPAATPPTGPAAAGEDAEPGLLPPPSLPEDRRAAFSGYEEALRLYEAEMADYGETIRQVVEVEYRRERERRLAFYNTNIDEKRIEERARRADAIVAFERFLERFPNHPEYTPDVLFRLAELHYEKAVDDYNQADAGYQLALERFEMGIDPDEPQEPRKDFRSTIDLFRRLVAEFPEYRQIDGAYYLMGICYDQMGEWDLAFASFETLVLNYEDSAFAQESWLRLGEYRFEEASFESARTAYERALAYGESNWLDKILFKLGWSNYLLSEFDAGITYFDQLLQYYLESEETAAALQEEALQYFAISVAEEDWNLDGERDADFVMPRVQTYLGADYDYTGDVLDRLAGILMENQRFEYVIDVSRHAIDRFECDPANLDRALQIVEALTQLREFDQALAMQRDLATRFGPGSEWYSCMERLGEMDAVAQAEQVVKDNLVETAARYYTAAQETRTEALYEDDPVLLMQSQEEFSFAANIYGDFLEQYPDDPLAYEMRMYFAQALLFAARYEEAAEQFGQVRDSLLSDEFIEIAAALAIQSYEYALEERIDSYELEGRAWPAYDGDNQWVAPEPIEPDPDEPREIEVVEDPIPDVSLAWAAAIDRYLELGLNSEDDPRTAFRYGFQVGKLYYDHQHYAAAEERFLIVLDRCDPEAPESGYAAGFLLNSYQARGDDAAVGTFEEALNGRYARCIDGDTLAVLRDDVHRIGGGILARSAEELFDAGDYQGAAEEYARLALEYAENAEFAPIGLFNSGLIYEQQLQRYEDAIEQFDLLLERYPESDFADDAHVRIAVNAKRFFDFDRAIEEFQYLDEIGFSDPELVEFPILDAALLMESVGRKREAAQAYLDWARDNPYQDRAPALMFTAAALYDDLGDHREMRRVFEEFRREYGRTSSELIDIDAAVINTYFRSAQAYEEEGEFRRARDEYDDLLAEFSLRLPDAIEAKFPAAKVVYDRAVELFDEWDEIQLGDTVEEQQEGLQERIEGLEPLALEFRAVTDYGSAEWTACAYWMEGRVFQVMADLLVSLPMPDFGGDWDAEDAYLNMVEGFAEQYENQSIAAWEVAYPLMQQLGVTNQCTVDMTAQLNRYRGAQYPVFRTAIEHVEAEIFSPPGFVAPPEPEVEPELEAPADDETGDDVDSSVAPSPAADDTAAPAIDVSPAEPAAPATTTDDGEEDPW